MCDHHNETHTFYFMGNQCVMRFTTSCSSWPLLSPDLSRPSVSVSIVHSFTGEWHANTKMIRDRKKRDATQMDGPRWKLGWRRVDRGIFSVPIRKPPRKHNQRVRYSRKDVVDITEAAHGTVSVLLHEVPRSVWCWLSLRGHGDASTRR